MERAISEKQPKCEYLLKQPSVIHLCNRQTKRLYASRIYARGRRGSTLERTL